NSASGATAAYSNVPATGATGWYDQNSGNTTHAVKGRNPNALGLYDMSGNIWESCFDWYTINSDHVRRGGGWYHADVWMQIGAMHFGFPYHADCFVGFRTARTQ
ncbi:MAG TPA: SUMF1/EgtB/PvdO family nonheme iron enzyme, partial [Spirochaetota bacterium]|nr:SUMF1/EgtB/PvdO family nonheme iron enzyme [Spirochaetota bacterium]